MMEILNDFSIRCDNCGRIFPISKSDLEPETSVYEHGENGMGSEIDYLIEDSTNCPYCNNQITFRIFGSEYPVGAFDSEDSDVIGGYFVVEPHMGILYEMIDFETDDAYIEASGIQRLIMKIAENKEQIYNITPRQFEQIVEQIFRDDGFETELTKETRDGGKDVIATKIIMGRPVVFYIECKQYRHDRPVGVSLVRALVGVQTMDKVNKTVLVTSAYFTKGACVEAARQNTLIDLIDGNRLQKLIEKSAAKYYHGEW